MIRLLFILLAVSIATRGAHAASVVLNGREDAGSTRILMEFDDLPRWTTEFVGRSLRMTFSTPDLSIDLSPVFRSIGRDRIGDIRIVADGIEIDLACDCRATVSQVADRALAADVRPLATVEVNATLSPEFIAPDDDDGGAIMPSTSRTTPSRVLPPALNVPETDTPFHSGFAVIEPRATLLPELDSLLMPRGSDTVGVLGEQLSRAVAQGLVNAEQDSGARSQVPDFSSSGHDEQNFAVTTGLDRAINPSLDRVPPTDLGLACLANSHIDVAGWGDIEDPMGLGKYRTGAVAEDGSLDAEGALALARYYLFLGFGAEAEAVSDYVDVQDRGIIRAVAEIMDLGHSDSNVLDGQVFCSGNVALWGALAGPIDQSRQPVSTNDILSTFSSLPPHLRSHLGPLLFERLDEAGLADESRNALNAVSRGGDATNESELAMARLELDGRDASTARETLETLTRSTDITAAEALLELLLDAETRGMAPNPTWIEEDVPSLVRMTEGTEIAAELNLAGMRGLITLDGFDRFRELLYEDEPGLDRDSRVDLAILAMSAVGWSTDANLLKTEIALSNLVDPTLLDRVARLKIAGRLTSLGLADRALKYLVADPETQSEISVVADALLDAGQADDAVQLLSSDLEHPHQLLGEAHLRAGDIQSAIEAFSQTEQQENAINSALRIADWNWIENNLGTEIADSIRVLNERQEATNSNGDLIHLSRDIRKNAKTLLSITDPD